VNLSANTCCALCQFLQPCGLLFACFISADVSLFDKILDAISYQPKTIPMCMKEVNSVRYAEAKLAYKIRYTGSKLPVI